MLTINQVLFHFNFFTLHLKLPLKHYYTFYLLKYFSPSQVDDHRRIYSSHSWTITMIRFLEECRSWPLIMMICLVCITLDFRVDEMLEILFNFLIFYQEHWVTSGSTSEVAETENRKVWFWWCEWWKLMRSHLESCN